MGNSASTHHHTKSSSSATAILTEDNDDKANVHLYRKDQQSQEKLQLKQQKSASALAQSDNSDPTSFQFSITKPTTTTVVASNVPGDTMTSQSKMTSGWTNSSSLATDTAAQLSPCATIPIGTATSSPKSVPGRTGWISNTGDTSPWYGGGSLSSSASSTHYRQPHRQSISGPYYRTRGMSVNQQQEPSEDDLAPSFSYKQHLTPPVSSSLSSTQPSQQQHQQQPPEHDFRHMKLTSSHESGVPTVITWSQGGNNVYVTGTFNGWKQKIKLVKSTNDFNTVIDLPLGTHRLKFIVDDEWRCSNDMETATDPDGKLVNYLQVMEEDNAYCNNQDDEILATPKEDYHSIIPKELLLISGEAEDDDERAALERNLPVPPMLPPHLEKVLLNTKTVTDEDNSVLPVPNHVTLNHLYACSIKDQVMALSTTTRFRKKTGAVVFSPFKTSNSSSDWKDQNKLWKLANSFIWNGDDMK